jgi:glycosyltransferase involved in cell wall biosynthesis
MRNDECEMHNGSKPPLHIGIDCRTVLQRKTGDRTYILNLLHGLAELKLDPAAWQFHLLLDGPDEDGVLPIGPGFQICVLSAPNSRLWTLAALPLYARRARLNLIHVQYLAPPLAPCPIVVTIHDVVWRAMPRTFPPLHRAVMRHFMPLSARRAARILCGTQAARAGIIRYLHVAPGKVRVTPYAVEPRFYQPISPPAVQAVRAKYGIGDAPYLLSVGVLQPRKNLPRLIAAFEQWKRTHPQSPHRLVIAGKPGWGEIPSHRSSFLIFTGYVADDELPALYAGAELFAYPSLYEGFGLPILEAMACGCPVLTSDGGAMAEVAGGAAELVDPRSIASIAAGLQGVLASEPRRAELRSAGFQRAAQFSAARQAAATVDVYRAILR